MRMRLMSTNCRDTRAAGTAERQGGVAARRAPGCQTGGQASRRMASGRRVPFPCLLTMHAASTTMSPRFDGLWETLVPDGRQRRQECQQLYSSSLIWAPVLLWEPTVSQ